jgi:hypothetical protein
MNWNLTKLFRRQPAVVNASELGNMIYTLKSIFGKDAATFLSATSGDGNLLESLDHSAPVSYTHLTLPTID